MTKDAKQAWGEVGDKFFLSWGRRVADRYHATESAEANAADDAERELKRAAKELIDELFLGVWAPRRHVPGRPGEEDLDRRRQLRDRRRHHRDRQRGHRRDPLEGRLIHAAASTAPADGVTRWRSPTASTV